MRHGKKINHLGRTASHRKAMLSNMASSLILHKRITTTVAKAKALRKYVEPLITKAKADSTHSRRVVFSYLQNKHSVDALFNEVADKVANRPGGYTRIIKMNNRLGDNAEMCIMELVDYNELMLTEEKSAGKKTRRSRRGGSSTSKSTGAKAESKKEAAEPKAEAKSEEPKAETKKAAPKKEAKKAEPKSKSSEENTEDKGE
ncbi:50S ribosomal protein L17 [Marinigracilibium pacificum]|uniref:Large ribosomal subunit protein bL17 n=1 Tax=Marinigracilibium pacificum TaxID=2729599 RepID=A0A848IYR0_9BACT|nr:50S ribosomal protein L17 [Marinigracilibium pacificum]NMM49407.1 50S ribosomal protein L17 [Marinigracilibium pacificum]